MEIHLKPLYSQLNYAPCPLGCNDRCLVKERATNLGMFPCPLSRHQAETCAAILSKEYNVIINVARTGDGKSLAAYLPALLDRQFRIMGLYPTIELAADQARQQEDYHQLFGFRPEETVKRVEHLYGAELARRSAGGSKFVELLTAIQNKPILLTNPDIFHYITHVFYRNPAYSGQKLIASLSRFPDLWVVDEFHIFAAHQETALLNSILLLRALYDNPDRPRQFLFTTATPKETWLNLLIKTGLKLKRVEGHYTDVPCSGYRQISQGINLEFISLTTEQNAEEWIQSNQERIAIYLQTEKRGRGLVILNSVAAVRRLANKLHMTGIEIINVTGQTDTQQRATNRRILLESDKPVLVLATSAVDVGVDFAIHLLIFEMADLSTFIQRLGRLGRHAGFSHYQGIALIPPSTPWIEARLREQFTEGASYKRDEFQEKMADVLEDRQDYGDYRRRWGGLQMEGLVEQLLTLSEDRSVIRPVIDTFLETVKSIYGEDSDCYRKQWYAIGQEKVGNLIQQELLRFRGSSDLQVGVWDRHQFYTYDLLRLIPHIKGRKIDRSEFLSQAEKRGFTKYEFPEGYLIGCIKVEAWLEKRQRINLYTSSDSEDLPACELTVVHNLYIEGHPQKDLGNFIKTCKLLAFLVPIGRKNNDRYWQLMRKLSLPPTFGLYQLFTSDRAAFACAFNQNALILEALKHRIAKEFCPDRSYIY
ncbi:MAG: type I-D CRISPR-associated helicase Cas3' [Pseudanabaenaceae cyanobacterium SKYGB_i_bin29]|nr:type I-D CRISPR-associated helicase Cas3' [Pseudanabaenaceae cyanobacterium SKYG29]MDW8420992.1 type I-D CRISPR-associated helicase Cas3' [Pseudanabaenaceae cyanobacterium SKYGB_i_bin29]